MGDEGDDSQKENLTGLDHLKRLRLDLSASDSNYGRNLDLQVPPVSADPSHVLTIHDAGGGGGFVSLHNSPLQQEDNEDLNTGGGDEKIVSGVGSTAANDGGGQGEFDDHGGENGVGQEEENFQVLDKASDHETGEPSDGDSPE